MIFGRQFRPALRKALVIAAFALLFIVLETTLLSRFRPFGAVPDLMLALTLAVAMFEGEKWGAVCGLAFGYAIEAAGSTGLSLLPLLYMLAGYLTGICAIYLLSKNLPSYMLYVLAAYAGRAVVTVIYVSVTRQTLNIIEVFPETVLPEFLSSLVFTPFIYLIIRKTLSRFHKASEMNN